MKEINKANETEISNREAIKAQQQKELNNCQIRLDNLLRLKISPDNKDGDLLNDEEFISQKKETLQAMKIIKEKMGDTEAQSQHWFNLCVDYVNFNKRLAEKFKTASPKKKREVFEFLYYNPKINAKLLSNSPESPHKFVIFYNKQKKAAQTLQNGLNKGQNEAFDLVCTIGRE